MGYNRDPLGYWHQGWTHTDDEYVDMTKEELKRELNHSKIMGGIAGAAITIVGMLAFLFGLDFFF